MHSLLLSASDVKSIPVEIVGGDGQSLHIFLALAGSAFVAIAAVTAAIVAARTANWRLRAQLNHDTDVRRREHVRDALDAAAEKLYEVFETLTVYALRIGEGEAARGELEKVKGEPNATPRDLDLATKSLEGLERQIEDVREQTTPQLLSAQGTELRLGLRIGSDDPIVDAHMELKVSFGKLRAALDNGRMRNRTADEIAECEKSNEESKLAYAEFFIVCEAWNRGQDHQVPTTS